MDSEDENLFIKIFTLTLLILIGAPLASFAQGRFINSLPQLQEKDYRPQTSYNCKGCSISDALGDALLEYPHIKEKLSSLENKALNDLEDFTGLKEEQILFVGGVLGSLVEQKISADAANLEYNFNGVPIRPEVEYTFDNEMKLGVEVSYRF